MRNFFLHLGKYLAFLATVFERPQRNSLWGQQFLKELQKTGLNSVAITVIVSFFIGAVICIQMSYNIVNPLIPRYLVGLSTRDVLLLELSSTVMCIILAGKVGSNIASEIGSMRVSEQIDAMEMMGVNSAQFLVLPKVISFMAFMPVLVLLSMITGILGGAMSITFSANTTMTDYVNGLQFAFEPYYITYSIIKSVFFAFIISTVSAYYGYYVEGGAIEVGKASTKTVVSVVILILVADLMLTQLLLS
ncbi:MAG: ABC transporter permease [Salinivirgaceae bacterium]|nr:ABC transporter permease [Salinivirgaceae bacterium]